MARRDRLNDVTPSTRWIFAVRLPDGTERAYTNADAARRLVVENPGAVLFRAELTWVKYHPRLRAVVEPVTDDDS